MSNYVSMGLFVAASVYIPIYAHSNIERFKAQWNQVNFEALKEFAEGRGTHYTESTLWFDLHYVVCALIIIAAIAMVLNCVWKIMLMKEERELLGNSGKKVKT